MGVKTKNTLKAGKKSGKTNTAGFTRHKTCAVELRRALQDLNELVLQG